MVSPKGNVAIGRHHPPDTLEDSQYSLLRESGNLPDMPDECPFNAQAEDSGRCSGKAPLQSVQIASNSAAIEVAFERYLAQAEAVEPPLQGKDVVLHALRLAVEDRVVCYRYASDRYSRHSLPSGAAESLELLVSCEP
jgi:hypothetical protein